MASGFLGIEMGKRALQSQRRSMEVTGHNISNANTDGYSRQRAIQSTTVPYTVPSMVSPSGAGQVGTGVKISSIERIRDEFVDDRIRSEGQGLGYASELKDGLHELELIINEPTEYGLRGSLDNFWESLQELINNPESLEVRRSVEQQGITLSESFNYLSSKISDYRSDLDQEINYQVRELNSLAERVADLNQQIVNVKGSGQNPNDLLDKRGQLLKEMSSIADVRINRGEQGDVSVSLGGSRMVQGASYQHISAEPTGSGAKLELSWAHSGDEVKVNSGSLRGIMDLRDDDAFIPGYQQQIDDLASSLIEGFNELHREGIGLDGTGGLDFFLGDDALSMEVNPEISETPGLIAAALPAKDAEAEIGSGEHGRIRMSVKNEGEEGNDYQVEVRVNSDPDQDPEVSFDDQVLTITLGTDDEGNADSDKNSAEDIAALIDSQLGDVFGVEFTGDGSGALAVEEDQGFSGGYDSDGLPGGNSNVIRLSSLFEQEVMEEDTATFNEFFGSIISELGIQSRGAASTAENQEHLVQQLENWQESTAGVSLDDEMANLIKFQHAYNAAARLVNVTDQLLDTVVNGLIR